MFRNREDAGRRLASRLKGRPWRKPVVLGIPRGGLVIGAVLARELQADLDVILARKLRAPGQPELALGALAETGEVLLNEEVYDRLEVSDTYLAKETKEQLAELKQRQKLFRSLRPRVSLEGRSVVVTDDGIATGSTMLAALKAIRDQKPTEVVVAVPVASPSRLKEVQRWCDEVVCLLRPESFWAIGQFYEDFTQVTDEEVKACFALEEPKPEIARNT